ncbi:MAG: aminopeptidase P family N-terminal domain-containing protein, partial [Bacteroidales bacterium]
VYIIPNCDPHLSEYPPERWRVRSWISGFTGSTGIAVITSNKAALWSDSRYFLQGEKELKGSEFIFFKEGLPETPAFYEWIQEEIANCGGALAIDDEAFSYLETEKIEKLFAKKGIKIVLDFNPIDKIWINRPEIPSEKIFEYEIKYAGESYQEKRKRLLDAAAKHDCNAILLTAMDDVAWAFNIRGADVPFNPVAVAYGYIGKRDNIIFIEQEKIDKNTYKYLTACKIRVMPYCFIYDYLLHLPSEERVLTDPIRTNSRLVGILKNKGNYILGQSPAMLMKSIKNNTEIEGTHKAVVRDGVAMVNFLYWIDSSIGKIPLDELSVSRKLHEMRANQPLFVGDSFATIAGYGPHGAIVHYTADRESNATLKPEGLLL